MLLAALTIAATGAIGQGTPRQTKDDFKREGSPAQRKLKDALEGKAPPRLQVTGWVNSKKPIELRALAGKVVVIKFWGTW